MSSKNDIVFVDAMNTAFMAEKYKHNGDVIIRDLEFGEAERITNKLVQSLEKVSGKNKNEILKSVIHISKKLKSADEGCKFFNKLLHRVSEDKGKAEVVRRLDRIAKDLIRGNPKSKRLKMDNPKVLKLMLLKVVSKLFKDAGWTSNEDKGYRWLHIGDKDPKEVGEKMLRLIEEFKKSSYLGDLSVRVLTMRAQSKSKSAKNNKSPKSPKSPKTTINRKKSSFKSPKITYYKTKKLSIEEALKRIIRSLSREQINNLLKNRMNYNSPRSFGQNSNNRHNILIRSFNPIYLRRKSSRYPRSSRRKSSSSNLTPRSIRPRSSRRKSRSAPF